MEQMNNLKVSFFKRIKWAIFNLENYDFFAVENPKKTYAYFIKLLLIFSLIISIALTIKLAVSYENTIENIEKTIQSAGDTNIEINKEAINQIKQLPKAEVCAVFLLVATFYLFMIYVINAVIDIALLSILGWFTTRMLKIVLKYKAIINICVYSLTLPILLNAIYIIVNIYTSFEIKYFQIMYNIISYIYVVTAILMIKSEIIKQEAEITKLKEEQDKTKEEIEEQEKENEEQEDDENGQEEKDKENEKNGEPQEGSSAVE